MYTSDRLHPSLFETWYSTKGWNPFGFQVEMRSHILKRRSGLLNAPTGSGKTYAVWIPLLELLGHTSCGTGLKVIWITPLRALAADIAAAMQHAAQVTGTHWRVDQRTGDTSAHARKKQLTAWPDAMVTTPESLHVLLSMPGNTEWLQSVEAVVVDEWHELLGNKRGTQTELVLARLDTLRQAAGKPPILRWGISATIANLPVARDALMGAYAAKSVLVKADIQKQLEMITVYPEEGERFPWAGHLGLKMTHKVLSVIESNTTTLVFTNTRAQCELWYHALLDASPALAGVIAMHHGSLDQDMRTWVEQSLHAGRLKVVVCTSSLDLGVDFRPVACVIQIGGPKGVARFVQRAGRSGHRPGEKSIIYFVPTHSLELLEAAALRKALQKGYVEPRIPIIMAMDVLVQYMVTLATGEGFDEGLLYQEVKRTHAFAKLDLPAWRWALHFVTTGGDALQQYDEYARVQLENGVFKVLHKKLALRHRLSIGTIVGDPSIKVQYLNGPALGSIEESFISRLSPGDSFWFAGKCLEFIRVKDITALVRKAAKEKGSVPQWMGGRMPFSSELAEMLRTELARCASDDTDSEELRFLRPVFEVQSIWSSIPAPDELLIEQIESKDGHHLFIYPFEGRVVHELLAALVAYRLGKKEPRTFSLAMNDHGFELLSEEPIDMYAAVREGLWSMNLLEEYLIASVNDSEMAKRRFREIAHIAGLVFQGYPGRKVSYKHLQASTQLIFDVLKTYDPDNMLLTQAFGEVVAFQLEAGRMFKLIERISNQRVVIRSCKTFTPLCFPIMVDRLRGRLSSEKVEDRVARMRKQMEAWL